MARDHTRIGTAIWDEESIRSLTRLQQQAYLLALSQADLSRCGVLAYRPRRWANTSSDGTEKALRRDYKQLVSTRHVIIDEDTEELFVRTYVRHDRILKQPNVVAALVSDYGLIASATIRTAFLVEMRRLWSLADLSDAERGGWLLAFGHYPAKVETGGKAEWPATMTTAALGRIQLAVGSGLRTPMREALSSKHAEPFTEGSPEGIPKPFTEPFTEPFPEPNREGFTEPPTRACVRAHDHAPARSPALTPSPSPAPASGGQAGGAGTQQLIAQWLDQCAKRPPSAVVGQVGKQLAALLADGQDLDDVRRGLATWHKRGLHPSTLPSVVHEVMNTPTPTGPPSTTDQRVGASLRRAAELRAQETNA